MPITTLVQSATQKKKGRKPSKSALNKKRRSRGGPFICILCGQGYSRADTIRNRHWATCVSKRGNPGNLVWDQHKSCWPKDKLGPSGTLARGLIERRGDDTEEKDGEREGSLNGEKEFELGEQRGERMEELEEIGETLGVWATLHLMRVRGCN